MNKTVCLSSDYIEFFGEEDGELSIELKYVNGIIEIIIKDVKKGSYKWHMKKI